MRDYYPKPLDQQFSVRDDFATNDLSRRGFVLQPVFSGEAFQKVVNYPVLVESYERVLRGGLEKRNYHFNFTPADRKIIARWHTKFRHWYLVTGAPQRVMLRLKTLELLIRAVGFFADPRGEQYHWARSKNANTSTAD